MADPFDVDLQSRDAGLNGRFEEWFPFVLGDGDFEKGCLWKACPQGEKIRLGWRLRYGRENGYLLGAARFCWNER